MNRSYACSLGLILMAGALAASPARAESPGERAAAEAAFAEGVKLLESGDVAAACGQFENAAELSERKAVGGLMMLADCYAKQGRLASAWATYKEVIAKARRAHQAERERTASERAAELEPRLPKLRLSLGAGFKRVDGLVLEQDGAERPLSLLTQSVPVDPGSVQIEVSAPGFKAFTTTVEAREGKLSEVELPPLQRIPEEMPGGVATAPQQSGPGAPGRDTGSPRTADHSLAYVVGGIGIAGIVVSGVLGVIAKSRYDTALEDGGCETVDSRMVCDDPGDANSARDLGHVATYVFVGGAAVTAVGALIYLLTPSARPSAGRPTAKLHPELALGPRGGWVGLGGTL